MFYQIENINKNTEDIIKEPNGNFIVEYINNKNEKFRQRLTSRVELVEKISELNYRSIETIQSGAGGAEKRKKEAKRNRASEKCGTPLNASTHALWEYQKKRKNWERCTKILEEIIAKKLPIFNEKH